MSTVLDLVFKIWRCLKKFNIFLKMQIFHLLVLELRSIWYSNFFYKVYMLVMQGSPDLCLILFKVSLAEKLSLDLVVMVHWWMLSFHNWLSSQLPRSTGQPYLVYGMIAMLTGLSGWLHLPLILISWFIC